MLVYLYHSLPSYQLLYNNDGLQLKKLHTLFHDDVFLGEPTDNRDIKMKNKTGALENFVVSITDGINKHWTYSNP